MWPETATDPSRALRTRAARSSGRRCTRHGRAGSSIRAAPRRRSRTRRAAPRNGAPVTAEDRRDASRGRASDPFRGNALSRGGDRSALHPWPLRHLPSPRPDGRPIISLASLLEPGTFDPAKMDTAAYPGIAVFTVMPGPLPAARRLRRAARNGAGDRNTPRRAAAGRRGAPLSVQRMQLREEVVAFERTLGSASGA